MRRISANYIYPVASAPIRNGIVETDDDGTIRKIYDFGGEMVELAHTEFLNGIIVPGFVNMHTHLELSNMKRIEPPGKDLAYFIENIVKERASGNALESAYRGDEFMYRKGIVAACDISNTNITIPVKKKSPIRYHTFVEITGLKSQIAKERFDQIIELKNEYIVNGLSADIAPHAPYSISTELWELLAKELNKQQHTSMHNQESAQENQMFLSGNGPLVELFKKMGLIEKFSSTGNSSLKSVAAYLKSEYILLVHNPQLSHNDLNYLQESGQKAGFVLCPTSNIQIGGEFPNVEMLLKSKLPVMLGTDSLASGQSLSLLDEMVCVQDHSDVPFEEMLRWVTINAAKFMKWDDLGALREGMKPGINLITGFDFEKKQLKSNAKIRRIL
jgi:cytosine/adenosine deaminase-related metal-dependent hydrolase